MSLEIAIQNLTAEVIGLRQFLQVQVATGTATAAAAPVAAAVPTFVPPAAVAAPVATFVPPAAVAAPVATFVPPAAVAAPAPGACPIVDQKTLVEYVMDAYKTLGPQKGAAIQGILNNCQVQSINECRPEHYAYIHQCVEQLKAS